jgi:A/G-specific adenine glycosylase
VSVASPNFPAESILTPEIIRNFRRTVYRHHRQLGREMPWRHTEDPYAILVSEFMLQQTQVERVIPFYTAFLTRFPTVAHLAGAGRAEVLRAWQGLGYNRRALYLQAAAQAVIERYGGVIPRETADLRALPGVGAYTAAAVRIFAYNYPEVTIETNIRRVYLHHFASSAHSGTDSSEAIPDSALFPLIRQTLDAGNPRQWYTALMDYGSMLGRGRENANRRSRAYVRQAPFAGSTRQVRGAILRQVARSGIATVSDLRTSLQFSPEKIDQSLDNLEREGFLVRDPTGTGYVLPGEESAKLRDK